MNTISKSKVFQGECGHETAETEHTYESYQRDGVFTGFI